MGVGSSKYLYVPAKDELWMALSEGRVVPTYEMLSAIMKEVAAEAKDNGKRASDAYFNAMLHDIDRKQAKWAARIKRIVDGRKN